MTLKAYMVFDRVGGPHEGAALVFANSCREARRLGWPEVQGWFGTEWINCLSRWLPARTEWLAKQEGVDMEGDPKVIDSPKACQRCELWGNSPLDAEGICERCRDDEEVE